MKLLYSSPDNMECMIVKVDREGPSVKIIEMAVEKLMQGGVIVYPTDTAYGLGGDATNNRAVDKIYEMKGRNYGKPTHVVVRDWEMISQLCEVNDIAWKLFKAFMPGPMTLVLPDRGVLDRRLGAGTGTLGVRIPNCPLTLALSKRMGRAYTTPSANRSGGKTPYSIEEVKKELEWEEADLVLDAGQLPLTTPSTIIDLSGVGWSVLREGPISVNDISKVLG